MLAAALLGLSIGDSIKPPPEQFGARIKAEFAKWTKIVRDTGAKPE